MNEQWSVQAAQPVSSTKLYTDSFIHSFIQAISVVPLQVHSETLQLEFHGKVPQATASEGLTQGPYMAARAGFEPTTLWTKGDEYTNEPPRSCFWLFALVIRGIC